MDLPLSMVFKTESGEIVIPGMTTAGAQSVEGQQVRLEQQTVEGKSGPLS